MARLGTIPVSSESGRQMSLEALRNPTFRVTTRNLLKHLMRFGLAFIFAQTMHPSIRFIGPAQAKLLGSNYHELGWVTLG